MKEKMFEQVYYLGVFESRNHALQLHSYLQKKTLNQFSLVSTPCQIKAGCSYSIKFNNIEDYILLKEGAELINKNISGVYKVERNYGRRIIKRINLSGYQN